MNQRRCDADSDRELNGAVGQTRELRHLVVRSPQPVPGLSGGAGYPPELLPRQPRRDGQEHDTDDQCPRDSLKDSADAENQRQDDKNDEQDGHG